MIIKKHYCVVLQVWQDLFLFFALAALWLSTANCLQGVISVATSSQEAIVQHNCLSFAFTNHPTHVVRMGNSSTMDTSSPVKLEFAIFGVIQMLLVMSGIETNPGPPSSATNAVCCNANQHFNRVRRVIEDVKSNFRTKVSPDTLTKPVIEIHEGGK